MGPHHDRHHRRSPDLDRTRNPGIQPHQDRQPGRLRARAGHPRSPSPAVAADPTIRPRATGPLLQVEVARRRDPEPVGTLPARLVSLYTIGVKAMIHDPTGGVRRGPLVGSPAHRGVAHLAERSQPNRSARSWGIPRSGSTDSETTTLRNDQGPWHQGPQLTCPR